jgi:hypothetical protein
MKLWIDDIRPAPEGYIWCHSVFRAMKEIMINENRIANGYDETPIQLIDIDHDSGEFYQYGGDYIKLLDWLEETNRNYPIRIHSMNPVGRENMRAIIRRNGWTEVF